MGKTLLGSLGTAAGTFLNRTSIPYALPGSRGFGMLVNRPAGMEAQMRAQGGNGTLYAIVDRIITSYSQVQWHLYRKAPSGLKTDRKEVASHAALDLWNRPNKFMTGPAFRETTQQHEELTGEQWWFIAKAENSTLPLELWPSRPDRMEPVPDPETFISGYTYRSPSGELIPLGLDDVIFQRRPNPMDPYRGLGPVGAILMNLDAARFSMEWNRNYFLNNAEPGGIVEVDKRLSDVEFDEHTARWAEQHKGVANAHRVALLENGIKWRDRSYSMRDMQFVELNAVSDEKIRGAFGFPKPMTGAVDNINRANADAGELVFARWLLVPRLERTKAALNESLLPMYGPGARDLEFDYDSPVPADIEADAAQLTSRATAAQALVNAGVYGPDALAAVGLPVMEFGQPGSDPNRELLIRLVTGAPSLAPMILPLLGFELPAPETPAGSTPTARLASQPTFAELTAGLTGDPENAMRWVVVAHDDDNICRPCKDNDGHLYRNREQAYADYPEGEGYVHCIGVTHGNPCRCKVVKRGKSEES